MTSSAISFSGNSTNAAANTPWFAVISVPIVEFALDNDTQFALHGDMDPFGFSSLETYLTGFPCPLGSSDPDGSTASKVFRKVVTDLSSSPRIASVVRNA